MFERLGSNLFQDLVSLCQPALSDLLKETETPQLGLFTGAEEQAELRLKEFISSTTLEALPSRYRNNIREAVMLFRFMEDKENISFPAVFTPLIGSLEDASNTLLLQRLELFVPSGKTAQEDFFHPELTAVEPKKRKYYDSEVNKLRRTLVFHSPISPMGHLKFALEAGSTREAPAPLFQALRTAFGDGQGHRFWRCSTLFTHSETSRLRIRRTKTKRFRERPRVLN